jgi:hypothetical protein
MAGSDSYSAVAVDSAGMAVLVAKGGRIQIIPSLANNPLPQSVQDYPGMGPNLYGVWMDREPGGIIVAVGANSFMVKGQKNQATDPSGWSRFEPIPAGGDLRGVAKRDNTWFVVGTKGIFRYTDGSQWQQISSRNADPVAAWNAIWYEPSSSSLFAVSNRGQLWHAARGELNGTTYALPASSQVSLNAIWGRSAERFFIAGDGGTILSCKLVPGQAPSCERESSNSSMKLNGVFATTDRLGTEIVYAVGAGATFVRLDPGGWQTKTPFAAGANDVLNAIAGDLSASDDHILAVGDGGRVYHRNLTARGGRRL